jgi:hypothetical protein
MSYQLSQVAEVLGTVLGDQSGDAQPTVPAALVTCDFEHFHGSRPPGAEGNRAIRRRSHAREHDENKRGRQLGAGRA